MKNKPISHKVDNIFKFESFRERLAKVNVSSVNYITKQIVFDDQTNDSYFYHTIRKSIDLNSTQNFAELRKNIGSVNSIQSLAQILLRKNELIDILIVNLKIKQNGAINPVLELIVSLARDLRSIFYPRFNEIFSSLVELIADSTDPEVIENTFLCLTYLFKFLCNHIIEDFESFFSIYAHKLLTSSKDYIRKFASESFSYLIRKAQNKSDLIEILFNTVNEDFNLLESVSQLIFETIKGVNKQLHSCSHSFLLTLIEKYIESENHSSNQLTYNVFQQIVSYLTEETSDLIWKILLNDIKCEIAVNKIIPLIEITVTHNNCDLVEDCSHLLNYLFKLLHQTNCDKSAILSILTSIQSLVLYKWQELKERDIKLINDEIYISNYLAIEQVLQFTRQLFVCPKFENMFLPSVINYCEKFFSGENIIYFIKFFTELIIKKRERIIYGYDIESISIYQLKFAKSNDFEKNLMKIINNASDLQLIWCCFVCLPHISSFNGQTNKCALIAETIMKLQLEYEYQTEPWMGYVLIESIMALILLKTGMTIIQEFPETFLCDLFKSHPSNTSILRALDLYLSYNKKSSKDIVLDTSFLGTISLNLAQNLSSYSKINRICALHILTLLDVDSISPDGSSIFSNCLKAELIPATIVDYRTKIIYLQNLDHSVVNHLSSVNNDKLIGLELMPFYYLLGALYENFKLLWTPILKLIEGFAKCSENKKQFVNILFSNLKNTTSHIYSDGIEYLKIFDNNIINYLNCETNLLSYDMDRSDHSNHRILLLKAMEMFPEIIESNNREFVDIFLSFIENEMKTQLVFSCLSKENISNLEEDCHNTGADKIVINKKPNITQKLFKTLYSFLNIFSKFKNPKALYRQPKLYKLFMDLLSYPNSEVQKGAFNCLFAYRYDYLNTFRDNFCRLIDEKTFKTEIYAIIDEENASILDNANRSDIVPILMRILYGKMILSGGTKTHGKNKSDFRRSLILKILSVFEESELIIFMDLIYAPIMHSLKLECLFKLKYEVLHDNTEEINIQNMIPLRQFQAMITTTLFISKHFGNKSTKITSYLYNVLIVISSLMNILLSNKFRGSLKESVIPVLKSIRIGCFKMAAKFFVLFDNYPYSSIQIDALFDGLIEPVLVYLDKDSVTSPSPMLKLFAKCSENPRYHCFFGKQLSDKQITPIDVIISLYSNQKTSQSVISVINGIIENLLTFENFVEIKNESYNVPEIVINGSYCSFDDPLNESELNFGSILLKPYATKILNRIQFTFNSNYSKIKSKKKRNSGFTLQELNILLRLSAFISDSQECTTLVKLIIFTLEVNKLDEEKEIINLKALTQLSKHLLGTEVRGILKNCIPLCESVKNRVSRQELCTFFATLAQNDSKMSNIIGDIIKINAFNPRFPEEPDYDTRLQGFKSINQMVESKKLNELDVDTIYLIHHNCVHLINCCDDTAIRESASNTVKNLIIKLSESENEIFNLYVIKQLLLTSICNGIKVESETVRHEFIEILTTLIKHCSHRHTILDQLSKLNNDEDQEIDFWLNIKHIQLHRRARALTRLAKNEELLKSFSNRVYSSFLLPLASGFLFNKQYAKNPSLINSSIEAIGSYCKYISWSKYDSLLKNYTKLLINPKYDQKFIIKIISSILDNFNFNEALCDETEMPMDMDIDHTSETKSDSDHLKKSNLNSITKSKINNSIYNCLIPLLHQTLHQKTHIDFVHDAMKSDYPEDEDIQRIPIALAIIKLLKLLNSQSDILESNLPSVFLRICQFLRSRTESIRETARSILIKIMQCLGPNYVKYAFNEMKSSLAKGYQRHVFVYTIHAILINLTQQLNCGDLDDCLNSLVELCNLDLFGNLSDEKEVKQITSKLREARKCKSYDIYFILSCFVSENSLTVLLDPLKSILLETYSYKVIKKVSLCLTKISFGLVDNKNMTLDVLLAFIYNIMNNPVEDKRIKKDADIKVTKPVKTHSFLISNKFINKKERIVKTNDLSKGYVLIEFGLNCFNCLIKQNKLIDLSDQNLSILSQFSSLLTNLLDSSNSKVGSYSLQCLYYLITKYPSMDSITRESQNIIGKIFLLLKKYRSNDQTNSQLISICYKTISLFLKDRNGLIDDEKIAVLISYAEQDIFHNTKQLTSFTLLKAILSRCPKSKELDQIMKKLFEMCILSDSEVIRKKCRKVCVIYLIGPSHQNKLKKQMNSFIRQLEYNDLSGRESVIIIINDLVSRISKDYLSANFADIFIPLSSRLVNENASNCKKLVAQTIKDLLNRLNESERNTIFDNMLIPWLNDDKVLKRSIAAHLCSIFIDVEKNEFSKRLISCLPLIRLQLDPTRYSNYDDSLDQRIKIYDNLVYQLLNVCSKLIKIYPDIIINKRWSENFNQIVGYIESDYLLHAHVWIRILSNQIFGQLFFYYCKDRIDQLVNAIINPSNHDQYMLNNSHQLIKDLCIKFCLIFRDIYNFNLLSDQLIHNLVSMGKVLIIVSSKKSINSKISDSDDKSINLKWLINKLLFEVKYEIKNNPNLVNKRIFVFKWIAAISALLGESGSESLEQYLPLILPPLCREESHMNSDSTNDKEINELQLLTKEILNIIKGIIGSEKFTDFYAISRNQLISKRQERRKLRAIEIVTNSMKSVKRKITKHRNDNRSKRPKIMS